MEASFQTIVSKFENSLWGYHVKIPQEIYQSFAAKKIKRVLLKIDDSEPMHSGFMPEGDGRYFLMFSKDVMKKTTIGWWAESQRIYLRRHLSVWYANFRRNERTVRTRSRRRRSISWTHSW